MTHCSASALRRSSHLAVAQHLLLVRLELWARSLLERDSQASDGVVVRTALRAGRRDASDAALAHAAHQRACARSDSAGAPAGPGRRRS